MTELTLFKEDKNDKGKDYAEYVKMSVPDLRALKLIYEEKIAMSKKQHWLNQLQKRFLVDVRKFLHRTLGAMLLIGLLGCIIFIILGFSNREFFIEHGITLMFILFIPLFITAILTGLLNEGTANEYRELAKIDLVLRNKESKSEQRRPNHKEIIIISLLAKYPEGLNRADILRLLQKEFGKSLDPKTVDTYLDNLSYTVEVTHEPYKSKCGGHDQSNTPIYRLKLGNSTTSSK